MALCGSEGVLVYRRHAQLASEMSPVPRVLGLSLFHLKNASTIAAFSMSVENRSIARILN